MREMRPVERGGAEPDPPPDLQWKPAYPRLIKATVAWRRLSMQWRHSYLLLAVAFWAVSRMSTIVIPKLENIRIMGGLHPFDVLCLRDELELMWVPLLIAAVLFALSFPIRRLNTAAAI